MAEVAAIIGKDSPLMLTLWGTNGRVVATHWCRTRESADRHRLESADAVQALLIGPDLRATYVRPDLRSSWREA